MRVSRGEFLQYTAQVCAGLALGGCSSRAERAAQNGRCSQVVVSTFGGDYEKLLQRFTDPLLKSKGIDILYDIGEETQHKTKLLVEKPLKVGNLDVVHFDDITAYSAYSGGTLAKIDYPNLPNAAHVLPEFATDYWVPHIYSAEVILYNPQRVSPAPNSYEVFWDPKYKGRVAMLQDTQAYWLRIAASLTGGTATNYEPGKAKLMELKVLEPKIFASQEDLAVAIKSDEVWLTPNWRARAYIWKKSGLPIENVVAKEGAVTVLYGGVVAKNAPDMDCSLAYLNAMLSPQSQIDFAMQMGYNPTISNARIPPHLRAQIGFTPAELKNFFHVNYGYLAQNEAAWQQWWQEHFLA